MKKGLFEPGLKVSIEIYHKNYVLTYVIGYEKDVYLILKMPYFNGKPLPLKSKDSSKIRFFKNGVAYGFESSVVSTQSFPANLIFLKYPEKIEQLLIRKGERVKVKIPAIFVIDTKGTKAEATIVDLSGNGCGLKLPVTDEVKASQNGRYRLSFEVIGNAIELDCSIRNLKIFENDQILGLEFINMSKEISEELQSMIDTVKDLFYQ